MHWFQPSFVFAALATSAIWAGSLPPSSAKPLSAVLKALESQGYFAITDVDFDDGQWEIEALHDTVPVELHVNPQTAEIARKEREGRHDDLPADATPLSEIIKGLEDDGFVAIAEIDFDGTHWEIEATRNGARYEIVVDIHSAKVLSEKLLIRRK